MTPTIDLQSVERLLIVTVELLVTIKRGLPELGADDRAVALAHIDELTDRVAKLKASLQTFELAYLQPAGNS